MDILTKESYVSILERLDKLKADTPALWGKMNAAEMLEHCKRATDVTLGKLELKPKWYVKLFFGSMIKKAVTDDSIYKHSLQTAPEYVVHDKSLDFNTQLIALKNSVEEFLNTPDHVLENTVHAIFGKMTAENWKKSQWKHLDHHLRQFGL